MAVSIDGPEAMDLDPVIDAFGQHNRSGFAYQPCSATDNTFCPSPESFLVQPAPFSSLLLDSENSRAVHMPQLDTFDKASPVSLRESVMPQLRMGSGYYNSTGREMYYQTQFPVGIYEDNTSHFADGRCQSLSPDFQSSMSCPIGSDSVPADDVSYYTDLDSTMTDSTSSLSIDAPDQYVDFQPVRFRDDSLYSDRHSGPLGLAIATSHHLLSQSKTFQKPMDHSCASFSGYSIGPTFADWPVPHERQGSTHPAASRLPRECGKPITEILPIARPVSLPAVPDSSSLRMHRFGEISSASESMATRGQTNERKGVRAQTSPILHDQVGSQASREIDIVRPNELEIHIYERPTGKRKLETQSSPKRDVWRKAKSACFACVWAKQACEVIEDGACTRCQKVLKQMTHLMPLPRFTCSTRTVFASLSIFTSPYPQMNTEDGCKTISAYPSPPPEAVALTIDPFVPILEALDPNIVRRSSLQFCMDPILTLSYLRNIVQRKEAFSIMFPELSNQLIAIEQRYRDWIYDLLCYIDNVARGKINATTAILLFLLYDEICALGSLPSVDQVAARHMRDTIGHYMILLRSNLLTSAVPNEQQRAPKKRKKNNLRKESDYELFLKLPHHLRLILINSKSRQFLPLECTQATSLLYHPAIDPDTYPQCSILHSTRKSSHWLPRNTTCLCSLALHCLPDDLFRPFGLSVSASDTCRRIQKLVFQGENAPKAAFMYSATHTNHDEEALSWFSTQYRQIIAHLMQCYLECITANVAPDSSRDRVLQESRYLRIKWKDVFAKVPVYIPANGIKLLASLLDWVIEEREDALSASPSDHIERWMQVSTPSPLEGIRDQMVYILRKRLAKFDVAMKLYNAKLEAL